jgi:hypothetical protein
MGKTTLGARSRLGVPIRSALLWKVDEPLNETDYVSRPPYQVSAA